MSTFSNSFVQRHNIDTPIQELWNIFKTQCENTLNSMPTKSLSRPTKRPWITSAIKRLSNKKKRLYTKARSSNSGLHIRKLRNLLKEKVARLTIVTYQTLSAQMMQTVIITIKDSGVI